MEKAIIKRLKEEDLKGSVGNKEVYPITHTMAVYNTENELLDDILKRILRSIEDVETGGIVIVSTSFDLPPVGDTNKLYIVKSENQSYYWNDDQLKYLPNGLKAEDISIIDANF